MPDEPVTLPGDEDQPALFEVEPDWKEHWQGMPDYSHEDLQPWQSIYVHFQTQKDREDFARLVGQTLHAKTKFIWHPKAKIDKASDKVWASGEKVVPRYPVYIISKGRWESRLTAKSLEWIGVPYHIVVEPQEFDQYTAVIDPTKILVTPFSNLGQGGIPARNFVWEHALTTGAARHWILDDNISGFCRFQDNLKVEVSSGATFKAIEDWVDRYEDVAMAAFNYDYFAPRKQGAKIKPITLNTRCYSGILIRNDLVDANGQPVRWRGRYNEDTDLSLRILKDGHCTALFNAFLMYKKPTLTMKGGNTDELYKGAEAMAAEWEAHAAQCSTCRACTDGYGSKLTPCDAGRTILSKDGRWLMAESLREQHPDCTTVERKWRRWQHQVDYRAFSPSLGRNILKLKEGIIIPVDGDAEYGMTIGVMPGDVSGHDARNSAIGRQTYDEPVAPSAPLPSALAFIAEMDSRPEQPVPASPPAGPGKAPGQEEKPATASPDQPLAQPEASQAADAFSNQAAAFILKQNLKERGHRLLTRDGKFFVSEASSLTPGDRDAIKQYREQLIALAEPWIEAGSSSTEVAAPSSGPSNGVTQVCNPAPASLFEEARPAQTLAQFLSSESPVARLDVNFVPDEPPDLTGIDEVVLNFATNGLEWAKGARPIGVTVSTLDGKLTRFLPFGFQYGGNLDEAAVKRWAQEQLRGKKILGARPKFDCHQSRCWGVDLEEQGCTFSDIQHTATLLDDHRKRVALDALCADYFPGEPFVGRVDEARHQEHHASEVAERERFTAQLVGRLRARMYSELEKQELIEVQKLEDECIPAVVEMEKNGSPLDLELMEKYHAECSRRHGDMLMEVSHEVGFAFDHTAKGWQRLFEKLGLPPTDGNDEATIFAIDHPLVKKAYLAAQYASLDSKTFKAYRENVGSDGILRVDINQMMSEKGGTRSGRFSIGYVQQVPNHDNHFAVFGEDLFPRRLFIPDRTFVGDYGEMPEYLEADAMQIEQRLLVHYMDNQKLIAEYADDLGRLLRGEETVSYHKVTWKMLKEGYKPDMLYSHTKNYNFAFQYGAKSIKLAVMMGFITEEQGNEIRAAKRWDDPRLKVTKEIEAAYRKMMPEGGALLDRAAHLAKPACDKYCKQGDSLHRQYPHRGYVKTLYGRRRRFLTNDRPYIGLNHVLQGTGADIMKKKLSELHKARKHTGLLMRLTIHDAVGGDARMKETKQRVSEVLNLQTTPLKVPILWSVKVGANWAACK